MPPKHDADTATRHYRAFWQRRCRAAAAEAVLKPLGGNCAVLPQKYPPSIWVLWATGWSCSPIETPSASSTRRMSSSGMRPARSLRRRLSSVRICSVSTMLSLARPQAVGPHADMGGQAVFILPAGDGGSDHSGAVPVADIVLNDKYRPDSPCSDPTTGLRSA